MRRSPSTGRGKAAISIIRISGPDANDALASLTREPLPPHRQAAVRTLANPKSGASHVQIINHNVQIINHNVQILNHNGATSGFEMCFCYGISAPWVPGDTAKAPLESIQHFEV